MPRQRALLTLRQARRPVVRSRYDRGSAPERSLWRYAFAPPLVSPPIHLYI